MRPTCLLPHLEQRSLTQSFLKSTKSEPVERSSAATGSNQANLLRGRSGYSPNMFDSRLRQAAFFSRMVQNASYAMAKTWLA